jgi:cobalt-zinc-cadmium efflux system protein
MSVHKDIDIHQTGNIKFAFVINVIFTIIEFIGGYYTNSIAIISDAVHDLGDSVSLGIAWYFQKKSQKGRDLKFSYGYKRFSIVGAVINSLILIFGAFFILNAAIPRIFNPQPTNAKGMILLALLGVAVNGVAYYKLRSGKTLNERVVGLHMLEDVLGWLAVLIGSIIMLFKEWYIIDAILSLFISAIILFNVFKNLKAAFKIILQAIPENIDFKLVEQNLRQIDNVVDLHDLHIWTLDGVNNILTVHFVVEDGTPTPIIHSIKETAREILVEMDIGHCTFEIEERSEECFYDKNG